MNNKVTFKPYDINQLKLPIDLAIDIPENHLVKIVNRAIERMNLTHLLKKYKGGGTNAYHPLMMLKVLVYAYTQKIYTARKIAKALRENIYFMWLSDKQTPNFSWQGAIFCTENGYLTKPIIILTSTPRKF